MTLPFAICKVRTAFPPRPPTSSHLFLRVRGGGGVAAAAAAVGALDSNPFM